MTGNESSRLQKKKKKKKGKLEGKKAYKQRKSKIEASYNATAGGDTVLKEKWNPTVPYSIQNLDQRNYAHKQILIYTMSKQGINKQSQSLVAFDTYDQCHFENHALCYILV